MAKRGRLKKKRQRVDTIKRPVRLRRYKMYFLIVCEDEKTEPTYFDHFKAQFPERTLYLECLGTGRHQLGVVEAAREIKAELENATHKKIDFTWVVFDKDDADRNGTTVGNFQRALTLAKDAGIQVALSNEAFELWLLLHFEDVDPALPILRQELYRRLEASIQRAEAPHLGTAATPFQYQHGKTDCLAKVHQLGDEQAAIQRAKGLAEHFSTVDALSSNPSTLLYRLVEELREWIRYYTF